MIDIRDEIIKAIEREIVGPCRNPNYLDPDTDEEILLQRVHGSPKLRYGAGMLYPQSSTIVEKPVDSGTGTDLVEVEEKRESKKLSNIKDGHGNSREEDELNDEPVGLANQFYPSALGFTVRFDERVEADITIDITSAFYEKMEGKIHVKGVDKTGNTKNIVLKSGDDLLSDYWVRRPIKIDPFQIRLQEIFTSKSRVFQKTIYPFITEDSTPWLSFKVYNRTTKTDIQQGFLTCTFVLVNERKAESDSRARNKNILFQNSLKISTLDKNHIIPYKEKELRTDTDEERELKLLYRNKRIFAIGHGTAVLWNPFQDGEDKKEHVTEIVSSIIPVYEMPQVASAGGNVRLSMLELSDKGNWETAKKSLNQLTHEYSIWIKGLEKRLTKDIGPAYRQAAQINIEKCKLTLSRIQKGIDILCSNSIDSEIVKCFRWMNRAMIWQQQRSKSKQRKWSNKGKTLAPLENGKSKFDSLEEFHKGKYNGKWRPFQIAFILMNIEAILNPKSEDREVVDLIWFPTGGGKTEAYLGLTALTILLRRIKGISSRFGGTTVLMRYTLRLLTTQQYERAASMICACDQIRLENPDELILDEPISIGLWVGGASTPNDHDKAKIQFNQLNKFKYAPYNFIVMKCPCCGAQIGKLPSATKNDKVKIKGLEKEDGRNGKVIFKCANRDCEYANSPLPLMVVDEYIYENPPTLVLGTVDKFTMLTWKPEAGKIFGFRKKNNIWNRIKPPELIIQDELHLISGPLGTMVGLYETMIQTLCNDYKSKRPPFIPKVNQNFIPPKIVASSATISRAYEQIKNLYGITTRNKLHIFPSQGLDFGNTWFSEEKKVSKEFPGRKYVGLLTQGFPSSQTAIVRSYSTILQKAYELKEENNIGFYWTMLSYFNSIRELGGASSLVFGDIPERLQQIQNRELTAYNNRRKLFDWKIQELTSRVNSEEIPLVLKKLEEKFTLNKNKALDICLATNMVATGVDVSRLGLMFIHGQPKTTAEYIQASSRVGRKLPDGPGLIFTLYSPSKPRDKSQYEQFQSYHNRIYSYVEPTSVTPFSINARDKALHAVLIGLMRHFSSEMVKDKPICTGEEFEKLKIFAKNIILSRCEIVNIDEKVNTERHLTSIISFWESNSFQHYGDAGNYGHLNNGYSPLLYASSAEVKDEIVDYSLSTPTSMRGVDTESQVFIYQKKYENEN